MSGVRVVLRRDRCNALRRPRDLRLVIPAPPGTEMLGATFRRQPTSRALLGFLELREYAGVNLPPPLSSLVDRLSNFRNKPDRDPRRLGNRLHVELNVGSSR